MRATLLDFRSPKETTPAPYFPVITNQGRRLSVGEAPKSSTFGHSQRFSPVSKDNFFKVGPGSYNSDFTDLQKSRVRGGCVYRKLHGERESGNPSYFYIGQQMVYDPNWKSSRKSSCQIYGKVKIPRRLQQPIRQIRKLKEFDTPEKPLDSPQKKKRKSPKRGRNSHSQIKQVVIKMRRESKYLTNKRVKHCKSCQNSLPETLKQFKMKGGYKLGKNFYCIENNTHLKQDRKKRYVLQNKRLAKKKKIKSKNFFEFQLLDRKQVLEVKPYHFN